MAQKADIYYGDPGDPFPDVDGTAIFLRSDGSEYVKYNGVWNERRKNDGIDRVKNSDGTLTLVIDNLRVNGEFVAEESYYQSLNGMNGALMIAPSGRVKNFSRVADHLLPTAKTFDVDYATDGAALLKGTVQPNDNDRIEYWFEYGLTIDEAPFSRQTRRMSLTGAGVITVSDVISGLIPLTQYEVRLCLKWKTGDYLSNAVRFTTMPKAQSPTEQPTVRTIDAASITTTTVTLEGRASRKAYTLTAFFKIWIADGAYEIIKAASPVGAGTDVLVSQAVTGLKASTAYYYCLCVSDGNTTWVGNQAQFTTLAVSGLTKPQAGAVAVSSISNEAATFTATVKPHGNACTYQFEWWSNPAGVMRSALVSSSSTSDVTATHTTPNLKPGRDYHVQLSIYYEDTTGAYSAVEVIKLTGATTQFTTTDT